MVKDKLLSEHLRRHVLRTAAVGRGQVVGPDSCFAETEICDFEVSVHIDHDVLWLDVAVDDVLPVEILQT